jgi:DNA-binding transcriptional MerR regulator
MKDFNIKKLYYSISEVSKITSLKPYVLRYWETEFEQLKPSKNRAGNRIYRARDIRVINLIKKLLYTDRYTIEGARQKLKKMNLQDVEQLNFSFERENIINQMRKDLTDVLNILNEH